VYVFLPCLAGLVHLSSITGLLLQLPAGPLLLAEPGPPNVWRVTCKCYIPARRPPPSFSFLSHSEMAAPPSKQPCRLFRSQGGCRYGNKCKYSHDPGSTSGTRTPPQSSLRNSPSSPTPATPRTRPGRSGNAGPKNVCDFYWNTGQCNRGFDCTFRHQKNTGPQPGSTDVASGVGDGEDAANAALEFFTMDNLTQMAGVGLHSTQEGTPENAHNSIKRYLGGGSLNNPTEMKPLISILASVNRRNHSWVRVIHHSCQMDTNHPADSG
jgi:hypothetical protein